MKKASLFFAITFIAWSFSYAQNTGIGTTTPNFRLHVTGGDLFVNSSTGSIRYGYEGSNQWRLSTIGGGSTLQWSTTTDGSNFTFRHMFDNSGDVGFGIGNVTPIARLDIKSDGNSSTTNAFMLRNSSGDTLMRVRDNGFMGIGYNGNSYGRPLNIQGNGMNFYNSTADYGGSIFPNSSGSMVLWAPGANVTLQPIGGSVTIGSYTAAAGYKLAVDGKVIFEEARVQLSTSWPDYVFANDYKLMSLTDLEQSVAKNKHLPNMPPASEVEKNGFDLGDMNKRLLEKVEELTLYIIQLDKEKNVLETRMNKMEKLMAEKK